MQGNRSGSESRTPSDVTNYFLVEYNLLWWPTVFNTVDIWDWRVLVQHQPEGEHSKASTGQQVRFGRPPGNRRPDGAVICQGIKFCAFRKLIFVVIQVPKPQALTFCTMYAHWKVERFSWTSFLVLLNFEKVLPHQGTLWTWYQYYFRSPYFFE